jgi:hypothetical protein
MNAGAGMNARAGRNAGAGRNEDVLRRILETRPPGSSAAGRARDPPADLSAAGVVVARSDLRRNHVRLGTGAVTAVAVTVVTSPSAWVAARPDQRRRRVRRPPPHRRARSGRRNHRPTTTPDGAPASASLRVFYLGNDRGQPRLCGVPRARRGRQHANGAHPHFTHRDARRPYRVRPDYATAGPSTRIRTSASRAAPRRRPDRVRELGPGIDPATLRQAVQQLVWTIPRAGPAAWTRYACGSTVSR